MQHRNVRSVGVDRGSLVKELVRRFDRVKDDDVLAERIDMHYITILSTPSGISFVLSGGRHVEQIPKERQRFGTRWQGKGAARGPMLSIQIPR
jgi:hypothetical protein